MLIGTTRFEPTGDIKNVLVTGGAGFIASWVVRHLVTTYPEYQVVCYDKLGYCSSLKNVSELEGKPNYTFVKGDIRDERQLSRVFESHSIDTVVHLAAESHVDHSFGNPYQFTYTNVLGTQVVLEVARRFKIRRVLHMSTDEVYGEVRPGDDDLLESSILVPTNPYAASKAASDMLVSAYTRSFKVPCVVVRCNNVYGPHQFPEKIIPKFISLLERGEKCMLHGDGSNTRRYLYAADAAAAIDTVLHLGKVGCIYNAGVETEMSNLQVLESLLDSMGLDSKESSVRAKYIGFTDDRPFNDARYAIDSQQIKSLGWAPKTKFEEGLKKTVDWYNENGKGWWGNVDEYLEPHPQTKLEPVVANTGPD